VLESLALSEYVHPITKSQCTMHNHFPEKIIFKRPSSALSRVTVKMGTFVISKEYITCSSACNTNALATRNWLSVSHVQKLEAFLHTLESSKTLGKIYKNELHCLSYGAHSVPAAFCRWILSQLKNDIKGTFT